jgi:hypothetical protein
MERTEGERVRVGWIADLGSDIRGGDYLFVVALALLFGAGALRVYRRFASVEPNARIDRFSGLTFQIGLILTLERLYEFSRAHVAVDQLTAAAFSNGYKIMDIEISLTHGFLYEQMLEHLFLHDTLLMRAVYAFYGFAHLFVTLSLLIWVYLRRNESFAFVRNMFYMTTGVALIIYMAFPTSPPRLFTNFGFVDPEQILGLSPAGGANATAQTFNPYAAMPSLHMVYALIVGAAFMILGRSMWLRLAGVSYPVVMLFVVLVSGNHWILDACGSVVVVAGCAMVLWSIRWIMQQLPPIRGISLGGRMPSSA